MSKLGTLEPLIGDISGLISAGIPAWIQVGIPERMPTVMYGCIWRGIPKGIIVRI